MVVLIMNSDKITGLYNIIKDYRSEDNDGKGMVDKARIKKWIHQFDENDRDFILTETAHILRKRYLPRLYIEKNIIRSIKKMAEVSDASGDILSFLSNSIFLDLQPSGKSQGVLLDLLTSSIKEKFDITIQTSSIEELNTHQMKHYIYFDDVLCTGNTFFQDIKEFFHSEDSSGREYYRRLLDGNIHLHCCFIFYHLLNGNKKRKQFSYEVSEGIEYHDNFHFYAHNHIDNRLNTTSELQIIKPLEEHQNDDVTNYKNQVDVQVEDYINNRYSSREEFYCPRDIPGEEKFFSSPKNRIRYTDILLKKGIAILLSSGATKPNIRPLGYSLPSIKDFGFGTMCFTWRNVPNNTPLVFWYSSGGFTALFPKKSTKFLTSLSLSSLAQETRVEVDLSELLG